MKITGFLALIVIVAGIAWWFQPEARTTIPLPPSETFSTGVMHEVILTDEGYKPETISLSRGDTIMFSNRTGRPFWPASNLHPSHRDYPEFDPREPILADETWTFVFTELGEWKYHDHLAPYHTGVIIVSE